MKDLLNQLLNDSGKEVEAEINNTLLKFYTMFSMSLFANLMFGNDSELKTKFLKEIGDKVILDFKKNYLTTADEDILEVVGDLVDKSYTNVITTHSEYLNQEHFELLVNSVKEHLNKKEKVNE